MKREEEGHSFLRAILPSTYLMIKEILTQEHAVSALRDQTQIIKLSSKLEYIAVYS